MVRVGLNFIIARRLVLTACKDSELILTQGTRGVVTCITSVCHRLGYKHWAVYS